MKRVWAMLLLCAVALSSLGLFGGCAAPSDEEDLGAEINMFFVGEVYDFDPAKAYTNDEAMKVMSLIYEPLFNIDAEGNLQYGLADSYRFYTDHFGNPMLELTLRETYWNDGERVAAEDVVYAWQRILDPNFPCQAATLLYEIKNARAAKLGDASHYQTGIEAEDEFVRITFEEELTEEKQQIFLRNLASVALTPLREDVVERPGRSEIWSKRVSYITTNGPFAIRAMDYYATVNAAVDFGHEFRLERNNYYRRAQESTSPVDLYVTPYKIRTYWNTDLDDAFVQFIEGSVFYAGDIPVEKRAEYLDQAQVTNLLSTYTFVLDVNDPVFADARVRRAFSLVLDRATIAAQATGGLGLPATGFVSHGVFNGTSGSFASVTAAGEFAISATADYQAALALVAEAKAEGYTGGDIRILVHENNEEEMAIAEAVKEAWELLYSDAGLSGRIRVFERSSETFQIKEHKDDKDYITLYKDVLQQAYTVSVDGDESGFGGFNVIGIDYQMLSPDAFAPLASLSYEMSGNGIHMGGIDPTATYIRTHVSGFNDALYNQFIDAAYEEDDMVIRTALLHRAEERLLDQMPIIPIVFNRSASLVNGALSRVYTNYFGFAVFTRTELRNYHDHLIGE